jgi:hypothetical protein
MRACVCDSDIIISQMQIFHFVNKYTIYDCNHINKPWIVFNVSCADPLARLPQHRKGDQKDLSQVGAAIQCF